MQILAYLLGFSLFVFGAWNLTVLSRKQWPYYITYTGVADDRTIYCFEGENQIRLYWNRQPYILYVPSDEVWNRDMPEWAKGRKAEIMPRIRRHFSGATCEDSEDVAGVKSEGGSQNMEAVTMKSSSSGINRTLSIGFIWLLRIALAIACLLIFTDNPSQVLHSLFIKIVYLLALVAVVVLLFLVLWLLIWCQDQLRGYSIQLSGNGDGGGVDYREGKNGLALDFGRSPLVIYLPSDEVWNRDAPAWAKARKTDIVASIKKQYKNAQYKEGGGVYSLNFDKSKAAELDALLEMKKLEERSQKLEVGS